MQKRKVRGLLQLVVFGFCCLALLNCSYSGPMGGPDEAVDVVQNDNAPVIAPYSEEEIENEGLPADGRATIPYDVTMTWRPGQATSNSPYFTIKEGPSGKLWVEVNFRPEGYTFYKKAEIYATYTDNPNDWMVNVGDSRTNNGGSGDGSTQSHDSEFQVYDRNFKLFAGDHGNGAVKKEVANFVPATGSSKWMRFYVSNGYTSYYSANTSGRVYSDQIFALNGQKDNEGKTNFTIYAGFNRVVSNTYRVGTGVNYVKIRLYLKDSVQKWTKPLVSDEIIDNQMQTHDQGYVQVGTKNGKMMIKKLSNTGTTSWTKTLTTAGTLRHVIYDTNNYDYLACGIYNGNYVFFCRYSPAGTLIEYKLLPLSASDKKVAELKVTSDGEIVALVDNYIYTMDSNFKLIFKKSFARKEHDGSMKDYSLASVVKEGSDFVIVGALELRGTMYGTWPTELFLRLDRYGNVKREVIGGKAGFSKIFRTESDYLVMGYGKNTHAPSGRSICRLDLNGNVIWRGGTGIYIKYGWLGACNKFRDGLVCSGWEYPKQETSIVTFDKSGNRVMVKDYPNIEITKVIATGDGGFSIITKSGILKTDQDGNY